MRFSGYESIVGCLTAVVIAKQSFTLACGYAKRRQIFSAVCAFNKYAILQ